MKRLHGLGLLLLLFLFFAGKVRGGEHCDSCEALNPDLIELAAYDETFKKSVCADCLAFARRCWVCKLPTHRKFRTSEDGRLFCEADFSRGVFDTKETASLVVQSSRELERALWRFQMKFPATNVSVSMVSCATLYDLFKAAYHPDRAGLVGLTITSCYDPSGKEVKLDERSSQPAGTKLRYEHQIYLATGLPEIHLQGTLAHELAHTWLHENLSYARFQALDRDTTEGFCELIAYQLMDQHADPQGKTAIRKNLYTMGQQTMLLEIDQGYGFDRILKWFHHGLGRRLQNVDQIRQVAEKRDAPLNPAVLPAVDQGTNLTQAAAPVTPPPVTLSRTVVLKGVMFGKNKRALINGVTFMQGDELKVKLADGPVLVKCIEIKENSAVLSINGESKEYFVRKSAN